jgi:hypothetical protein
LASDGVGLSEAEIDLIDRPREARHVASWVLPLRLYERRETTFGDVARFG